jgi:endonuclease III-like uncharacterized protein
MLVGLTLTQKTSERERERSVRNLTAADGRGNFVNIAKSHIEEKYK